MSSCSRSQAVSTPVLPSAASRPGPTERATTTVGGLIHYAIDALVADGDMVAIAWTGTLPGGAEMKGLSLYRVAGGLLRWTRHALIGDMPA